MFGSGVETPVQSFRRTIYDKREEIILDSNILKLITLRHQRDFLKRLCEFTLNEALFNVNADTISVYLDNILRMDIDINSLDFIINEVNTSIIAKIMVCAVTKVNLFANSIRTKKQRIALIQNYVDWCKSDAYGFVPKVTMVSFENLILKLQDLREKKSVNFMHTNFIASNGRFVPVTSVTIEEFFAMYSADIKALTIDKQKREAMFVYTPAGVYGVGNKITGLPIFWEDTPQKLIDTLRHIK